MIWFLDFSSFATPNYVYVYIYVVFPLLRGLQSKCPSFEPTTESDEDNGSSSHSPVDSPGAREQHGVHLQHGTAEHCDVARWLSVISTTKESLMYLDPLSHKASELCSAKFQGRVGWLSPFRTLHRYLSLFLPRSDRVKPDHSALYKTRTPMYRRVCGRQLWPALAHGKNQNPSQLNGNVRESPNMQCRKIKLSKSWERKKLAKLRTYLAGDRSMRSKKPLLQDTVKLAEGCDAVCTFVNDFAGGMNGLSQSHNLGWRPSLVGWRPSLLRCQ